MITDSKDRTYKLIGKAAPLSLTIASRNAANYPLFKYDEKTRTSRALRYASNHNSPYIDEQNGEAICPPIVFEDGWLRVPKEYPALQDFLAITPDNGRIFKEYSPSDDALIENEKLDMVADAMFAAKNLSMAQMEELMRVLLKKDPDRVESQVMMRDLKLYAKNHPKEFLAAIDSPDVSIEAKVRSFFDKGLLVLKKKQHAVHFNVPGNDDKMFGIPFGQINNYIAHTSNFLVTDAGIEHLKNLESMATLE